MSLYDKIMGNHSVTATTNINIEKFLSPGEEIIATFQCYRDSYTFTNFGVYFIDVQGITGKKVETKFFPKKNITYVSFETAGTIDFDLDIKVGLNGNTAFNQNGIQYNIPLSIKVPKNQINQVEEIVQLIKTNYLV